MIEMFTSQSLIYVQKQDMSEKMKKSEQGFTPDERSKSLPSEEPLSVGERIESTLAYDPELAPHRFEITVVYGQHASSEDGAAIAPYFEDCDVYVPEVAAWTPTEIKIYQLFAAGNYSEAFDILEPRIKNAAFPEYDMAIFRMIAGSKKPVALLDIPSEHPLADFSGELWDEMNRGIEEIEKRLQSGKPVDFADALDRIRQFAANIAAESFEREKHIVHQFPVKMKELLGMHPELQDKSPIRVLFSYGSLHTPIARLFQKEGYPTSLHSSYFSHIPYRFGPDGHITSRTYRFGMRPSDLDAARDLFSMLIMPRSLSRFQSKSGIDNPFEKREIARMAIDFLYQYIEKQPLEELKRIYENELGGFLRGENNTLFEEISYSIDGFIEAYKRAKETQEK